MAQSFLPQQRDSRTFGAQQIRLLNDLNRPDLSDIVIDYLQDAMRHFSRSAFFFTELDNREVPEWAPNTMYPLGSCVRVISGLRDEDHEVYRDVFCAISPGINQSGEEEPEWPSDLYSPPPGSGFYERPPIDEWGVVEDGEVLWGNIGDYRPGYHTQLSTVPRVNRYTPPIDYVSPYLVQITTANLKLILEKLPFMELSAYDVIQPGPIAAYPRQWAYWGGEIYLWVYPTSFFPITLSYNAAPLLPAGADKSNFWTTQGERLIRKYAQAAISREVLYDQAAAQLALSAASEELGRLKTQAVAQQGYRIPGYDW